MTRALNQLFNDHGFVEYGMPKRISNFNHLAYVDGTVIFSSSFRYSMENIMKILQEYELESCQKVNRNKSFFYMYQNAPKGEVQNMEKIPGMIKISFTIKFLATFYRIQIRRNNTMQS